MAMQKGVTVVIIDPEQVEREHAAMHAAAEAVQLAQQFRRIGNIDDACEMYDDAFGLSASILGEAHPLTLHIQREYSMFLTILHINPLACLPQSALLN